MYWSVSKHQYRQIQTLCIGVYLPTYGVVCVAALASPAAGAGGAAAAGAGPSLSLASPTSSQKNASEPAWAPAPALRLVGQKISLPGSYKLMPAPLCLVAIHIRFHNVTVERSTDCH
jgi:hypothetical protein